MAENAEPPLALVAYAEIENVGRHFNIAGTGPELFDILMATAFRGVETSPAQMVALMVVSKQYHLNPFTKEIYAVFDRQKGVVPVVSVDGWSRIINERPELDGVEFRYSETISELAGAKPCPEWCECVIYRKDRGKPLVIREYLDEVYVPPRVKDGKTISGPWQTHTKRMLRHKTLIQASRISFGFSGIYDPDEADGIVEGSYREVEPDQRKTIERPKSTKTKTKDPVQETPPAEPDNADDLPPHDPVTGKIIEDGKFEEVASGQEGESIAQTASEPAASAATSEAKGPEQKPVEAAAATAPSSGGGDVISHGMLSLIISKADERGISENEILERFGISTNLNAISAIKASEVLSWIKTRPLP